MNYLEHISWTRLKGDNCVHSGDITSAPAGATEFIDYRLSSIRKDAKYLVPTVLKFNSDGEDFDELGECFFGYMERTEDQFGKPFEPSTVVCKSDLKGKGRNALPVIFERSSSSWNAKWVHLYLGGEAKFQSVENHKKVQELIAMGVIGRDFLKVSDIVQIFGERYDVYDGRPCLYIGRNRPDDLPAGSKCITLKNIHEIIPD